MSIDTIDSWDWPDTGLERDGYDTKTVPALSQANFQLLAEKVNELVAALNQQEESE